MKNSQLFQKKAEDEEKQRVKNRCDKFKKAARWLI
jgi:hypothetical protein